MTCKASDICHRFEVKIGGTLIDVSAVVSRNLKVGPRAQVQGSRGPSFGFPAADTSIKVGTTYFHPETMSNVEA